MADDRSTELTAEIVVAFLNHGTIQPDRLPGLVEAIRRALGPTQEHELPPVRESQHSPGNRESAEVAAADRPSERIPAVSVEASVTRDYLISLEDGKRYRSLKRHLMAKYGLTPDEYRAKWGLAPDYPMVAASLAEKRSRDAKLAGLGLKTPKTSTAPRRRRVAKASRRS